MISIELGKLVEQCEAVKSVDDVLIMYAEIKNAQDLLKSALNNLKNSASELVIKNLQNGGEGKVRGNIGTMYLSSPSVRKSYKMASIKRQIEQYPDSDISKFLLSIENTTEISGGVQFRLRKGNNNEIS